MGRRGRLHDGAIIIIITVTWCVHEINSTKKKHAYTYHIIQMKTSCQFYDLSVRTTRWLPIFRTCIYAPQYSSGNVHAHGAFTVYQLPRI